MIHSSLMRRPAACPRDPNYMFWIQPKSRRMTVDGVFYFEDVAPELSADQHEIGIHRCHDTILQLVRVKLIALLHL